MLDFSVAEIEAVRLSLRIAFSAMPGSSLGGFSATITFVSNIPGETRTIVSAIYTLTQAPDGDVGALRLTLVSIALSFAALLAADLLARRMARRLSGE